MAPNREKQNQAILPASGRFSRVAGRLSARTGFSRGLMSGVPIALGYVAVSFAYGLYAAQGGMTPLAAAFLSLTNVTSAGQFAGTRLFFAGAPYLEIGLTTLWINLRYMLMSLSLSQKLRPGLPWYWRILIGYGVTDEIYAVAVTQCGEIGVAFMTGLIALPVAGWTGGTLLGALAGSILPLSVRSALGIALYAMFLAIIIPPSRKSRPVLMVVLLAAALSVLCQVIPVLASVPSGWRLIGCTVAAALAGAVMAPIRTMPGQEVE